MTRWPVLVLAAVCAVPAAAEAQTREVPDVRFVVLGHIRSDATSDLNPRLGELIDEVRGLQPAFVVLTGDIIWGDVNSPSPDLARVEREWEAVDSRLATLGVPVHRVPGNHDISGIGTRDIWRRRYGPLPQAVTASGVRLLLLSSAWIPADGDARQNPYVRGVDLDPAQVAWLEHELSGSGTVPTFAFIHHLLWWQTEDGKWWKDVHPVLSRGGVQAVFSGDYGPLKFSTLARDGVRYFQCSIETPVGLRMLQINPPSRVLSAQFDNYLEVVVRGGQADVRVHTISEVSSGEFTPERHRAVTARLPPEPRPWHEVLLNSRKIIGASALAAGILAGWAIGRRRRT
jgi:hypothetical protein